MKNILIVGYNGFIGNHLTSWLLANNFKVYGISQTDNNINNISDLQLDISDKNKLLNLRLNSEFDVIIHLAAIKNPYASKDYIYNVNVKGTRNICEFAKKNNIPRIIFFSTVAVYGKQLNKIINEDSEYCPEDHYAQSKVRSEEIIKNSGLLWTIVRPTNVFGEADETYKKYFQKVENNKFIVFYKNRYTHLVYVKDVADVILEIIKNKNSIREDYIIADKNHDFFERDLFKLILSLKNKHKFLFKSPFDNSILNDRTTYSSNKLLKKFNYTFKFGLQNGIKNYLEYYGI